MKSLWRILAAFALLALVTLGGSSNASATPIKAIGECYDAPMPAEPSSGMTWIPDEGKKWPNDKAHNPMKNPDPKVFNEHPPQMVYGFNPVTPIYDNGCGPIPGIMPGVGNSVGNMFYATIPGTLQSWGYGAMRSAIDPSWLGSLDKSVETSTRSVSQGTWGPFAAVTIMLVAAVVLWRARTGALPAVVTGVVWMLGVLTFVTFTVSYPAEAPKLVDKSVQGATTQIANGFQGSGANGASKNATNAVDRMWGEVWMNTLYRSWADASFGSAESKMAKKYGRELFDLEHFTASEWEVYQSDPAGKGKDIAMDKKKRFDYVAQKKVKKEDPIAYDYLTGNRWGQRMTTGVISLLVTVSVVFFLLIASAALLVSYLVTRLLVPFAPAGGVIFLLDAFRDHVVKGAQKLAMILVAGPVMLVGALVVMRIHGAIWGAKDIPNVVQIFLVIATSVIAWKLLKPAQFFSMPHGAGMAGRALRTVAAYKFGHSRGEDDGEKKEKKKQDDADSNSSSDSGPVAAPEPLPTGPFVAPPPASAEDVDSSAGVHQGEPVGHVTVTPVRRSTPGTFVPRGTVEPGRTARDNRMLSAGPTAYETDTEGSNAGSVPSATTLPPAARPLMVEAPTATSTHNADDADLDAPLDDGSSTPNRPGGAGGASTPGTFVPASRIAPAVTVPPTDAGQAGADEQLADATTGATVHTPTPADAGQAVDVDEAPGHVAPEQVGTVRIGKRQPQTESEGAIEPSAIWSPATEHNVMDVDESNVTYDENGAPEFVIYHPTSSTHYGVE